MANSYTTVPNVLPGNVSVGGDLDVKGEVRVGAFSRRLHLWAYDNGNVAMAHNLKPPGTTRDDAAAAASYHSLGDRANTPALSLINAAGGEMRSAEMTALATDYVGHVHTGGVFADTIYSKLIRANLLGANGGIKVRVFVRSDVQGGPPTTYRVLFGGTVVATVASAATGDKSIEVYIINQGLAASQGAFGSYWEAATLFPVPSVGLGEITSADLTVAFTIQNGTATDAQTSLFWHVALLNSFGPV